MKTTRLALLALTACSAALMGLALAANETTAPPTPPASGAMGTPPGPPPEAVTACNGKAEGAAVSFTGRGGETLTGTCQSRQGVLAARPAGMGGGQRPPPPAQR